ncbi:putative TIM-barrel fold metal-dependent hydrolase [Bradyrhizobium yuanmingense]|uniref:TIM-barrel fold metal-dependent hydrolase n=1 Tax=Bradyrhizobium yuanmingense TaxID=108015 RepID=A0ABV4GBH4_9BRAD
MKSRRLHLMGASGCGVTTIGRALAGQLALPHHDSDDYFWLPTVPPYRTTRPAADRLRLMHEMFLPRLDWVLSGSVTGWGEELVSYFDLVVFVTAPREIRMKRLRAREAAHFGADAVAPGGWRHAKPKTSSNGLPITKPAIAKAAVSPSTKPGSPACPARSYAWTAHVRLRSLSSSYAAKRSGCPADVIFSSHSPIKKQTGREIVLSRRSALLASLAAGVAMTSKAHARAAQPATPINFDVPAHACDCHTHIHGDVEKFPFFTGRVYTPEPASPEEMAALHKALHIERVVIVTPSVYGTDNSSTLFGMKARGATARGVAVIDDKTPESALDTMHQDGFRGIRLNLATGGVNDPNVGRPRFTAAVERMKARGWHVQLYTTLAMISAIKDLVETAPVPVVFDHFGGLEASLGLEQPGFSDLVALVKSGKAYVKISGAYRSSKLAPDYQDMVPYARALIAANADRIVWGTDWPHPDSSRVEGRKPTDIAPLYQIDDGRLLNQLPVWAPNAEVRKKILVDNPARLYGF